MSTTNAAKEAEFDLVIRGGRIVDGTRMPAYYGDLAVKAGVIVEIGSVRGKGSRGTRRARINRCAGLHRHPYPL